MEPPQTISLFSNGVPQSIHPKFCDACHGRAAPSPAEREQRANRGGGVVRVGKTEGVAREITNYELHCL